MFSAISWSQYVTFMIIATAGYYLFVWVVHFKGKLPSFPVGGQAGGFSMHGEDGSGEVTSTVQHVMEALQPVFENRGNRNELVMALQKSLERYRDWDEPGFREALNDYMARESASVCSIHLGEEDFRVIWKG